MLEEKAAASEHLRSGSRLLVLRSSNGILDCPNMGVGFVSLLHLLLRLLVTLLLDSPPFADTLLVVMFLLPLPGLRGSSSEIALRNGLIGQGPCLCNGVRLVLLESVLVCRAGWGGVSES